MPGNGENKFRGCDRTAARFIENFRAKKYSPMHDRFPCNNKRVILRVNLLTHGAHFTNQHANFKFALPQADKFLITSLSPLIVGKCGSLVVNHDMSLNYHHHHHNHYSAQPVDEVNNLVRINIYR